MRYIVILFLIFFTSCKTSEDVNPRFKFLPKNERQLVVADYASLLSENEKDSLANKIIDFEEKTANQIVVVTVDSIFPFVSISQYATDLGNYWGVGRKGPDNGLLIVIAKFDRKISIATGCGTEKILTDSICKFIIGKKMTPEFADGNFYKGVDGAIDEIMLKWVGE